MRKDSLMVVVLTAAMMILGACNNSSAKSDIEIADQSSTRESASVVQEDLPHDDVITEQEDATSENTETNQENGQEETASPAGGDSKKEEYLQILKDTKAEADQLKESDSSTYALKKVANDKWEIWDKRLNEIYGILQEQLSQDEMGRLREEQRDWIKYRDETALEASLKFKGGTQEHLEYVTVLANLTEERCYELVEGYMK
ncbi:lysozyme inhibitor LprI family protein [Bhargavaea ginsengi]|uniref:lysozyme inhibitor LprI family protein n=1 Tax=Bhargavaea ginsengi TaxID=426757 RepID=UPI003C792BFC